MVSLKLPEDFLRLAYVKMSDWTRGVSKAVYPSQATFPFTSSKWDGIRGSPQRPVAVIMPWKDGSRELCLYSSAKEASLETLLYFPRPSIGTDGDIRIPSSLYPRLIIALKDLISPL